MQTPDPDAGPHTATTAEYIVLEVRATPASHREGGGIEWTLRSQYSAQTAVPKIRGSAVQKKIYGESQVKYSGKSGDAQFVGAQRFTPY